MNSYIYFFKNLFFRSFLDILKPLLSIQIAHEVRFIMNSIFYEEDGNGEIEKTDRWDGGNDPPAETVGGDVLEGARSPVGRQSVVERAAIIEAQARREASLERQRHGARGPIRLQGRSIRQPHHS